jgi:hypothetical protein
VAEAVAVAAAVAEAVAEAVHPHHLPMAVPVAEAEAVAVAEVAPAARAPVVEVPVLAAVTAARADWVLAPYPWVARTAGSMDSKFATGRRTTAAKVTVMMIARVENPHRPTMAVAAAAAAAEVAVAAAASVAVVVVFVTPMPKQTLLKGNDSQRLVMPQEWARVRVTAMVTEAPAMVALVGAAAVAVGAPARIPGPRADCPRDRRTDFVVVGPGTSPSAAAA